MKSYLVLVIALSLAPPAAISQQIPKEMPKGFDSLRKCTATGKLDSITCSAKTDGADRRALIYPPPGSIKKKNILCCIFCMESAGPHMAGVEKQPVQFCSVTFQIN